MRQHLGDLPCDAELMGSEANFWRSDWSAAMEHGKSIVKEHHMQSS